MRILVYLLLVGCCLTHTTTENYDIVESLLSERNLKMKLIQVKNEVDYTFSLKASDSWSLYQGFREEVELGFSQFVNIEYRIVAILGNNYFVTRVKIDGKEDKSFRMIYGNI